MGKTSLTPLQGITSGILCNILVCAAVLMAMASKDVTGKLLASFFVVMPFVTGGFEHCVANMYYISAGLLAKTNPDFVKIAGGSLVIGLPMYYINTNLKLSKKGSKKNDVHYDYAGNFGN